MDKVNMASNPSLDLSRVIPRAWADESFLQLLKSEPRNALRELGYELPSDVEVSVIEDTQSKIHVVIPVSPLKQSPIVDSLEPQGGASQVINAASKCCLWPPAPSFSKTHK